MNTYLALFILFFASHTSQAADQFRPRLAEGYLEDFENAGINYQVHNGYVFVVKVVAIVLKVPSRITVVDASGRKYDVEVTKLTPSLPKVGQRVAVANYSIIDFVNQIEVQTRNLVLLPDHVHEGAKLTLVRFE